MTYKTSIFYFFGRTIFVLWLVAHPTYPSFFLLLSFMGRTFLLPFSNVWIKRVIAGRFEQRKEIITSKEASLQHNQFGIRGLIGIVFIFILIFNLRGLNVFVGQIFLVKISLSLIFLSLTF